jgi:hypothetical protein
MWSMPENGESTKFTFNAVHLIPTSWPLQKGGGWIWSDHCQRLKETADLQLLLSTISRSR